MTCKNNFLKLFTLIYLLFSAQHLFSQNSQAVFERFNKLYSEKQFFKLRDELNKNNSLQDNVSKEYFTSLIYSVFNKPSQSNALIDKLLNENKNSLSDSMLVEIYKAKMVNNVNLFKYNEALAASEIILSQFKHMIDTEEADSFRNSDMIWNAASNADPQTVTISADTRLGVKKDMAGLMNIKVSVNGSEEEFIFDTGANFSTISDSYAKKLGLKFFEGEIEVGTSTDKKVTSKLALAGSLQIGNLKYGNVLFLVLPDEALSFGGGVYVINGIIGFPVIKEMKEISIADDEIFIPVQSYSSSYQNLSLNEFMPLIQTIVNSDTLVFSFDTGARKTSILYPYYMDNKSEIDGSYELMDLKVGGAGGEIIVKGFKLNDLNFQIASGKAVLDNVSLYSKLIKDDDEFIYGNLGGDFIHQFKKMIINFEHMYVEFEN